MTRLHALTREQLHTAVWAHKQARAEIARCVWCAAGKTATGWMADIWMEWV